MTWISADAEQGPDTPTALPYACANASRHQAARAPRDHGRGHRGPGGCRSQHRAGVRHPRHRRAVHRVRGARVVPVQGAAGFHTRTDHRVRRSDDFRRCVAPALVSRPVGLSHVRKDRCSASREPVHARSGGVSARSHLSARVSSVQKHEVRLRTGVHCGFCCRSSRVRQLPGLRTAVLPAARGFSRVGCSAHRLPVHPKLGRGRVRWS